jgi:hypothetical protein
MEKGELVQIGILLVKDTQNLAILQTPECIALTVLA